MVALIKERYRKTIYESIAILIVLLLFSQPRRFTSFTTYCAWVIIIILHLLCIRIYQVQKRVAQKSCTLVASAALVPVDYDLGRQFGSQVRVQHRNVFVAVRDRDQIAAVPPGHHQESGGHRVRGLRRFDERRIASTRYGKTSNHVFERRPRTKTTEIKTPYGT